MLKVLQPIRDKDEYSDPMAQRVAQALYEAIFRPVLDILGVKVDKRINSYQDLKNAVRAGRVYWVDGYFYGEFNAAVGKALRDIGADFARSKEAYKLPMEQLPSDLRTDIVIGKGMNRGKTEAILKALKQASEMKLIIGSGDAPVSVMAELDDDSIQTMKVLPQHLQLPYTLTDKQKQVMTKEYSENLALGVKNWQDEAILRLREKTEANALLGYRADRLAGIVVNEFDVTKKKARFLARQETSLFVSKYRELRYTNAGIKEYIWSTSKDGHRVRADHRALDGQKFTWDSPPVVDQATGKRGHPGQDFNCRCLALPVVRIGATT